MNKTLLIGAIVLTTILVGAVAVWGMNAKSHTDLEPVATATPVAYECNADGKICPDGTVIGRTGYSCEFPACPASSLIPEVEKSVAMLNQRILNNGIHITPLEILEDSRCPTDVQCIQAGTVRVRVKLEGSGGTQIEVLTLSHATAFGTKQVTLTNVTPTKSSAHGVSASDYRFTFFVKDSIVTKGTLSGTMTLGPLCPVEQADKPCKPTAEMYATRKVAIYKDDQKTLVTILTPDVNGSFSAPLAAGTYFVNMEKPSHGEIGRASGVPATIVIRGGKTTLLSIDIDTGIR